MFCKYLHNNSSDLYQILNLSSYVSNKLPHLRLSLKYHKDLSFCCGVICKTLLTFKNHQFWCNLHISKVLRLQCLQRCIMYNFWMVKEFFGNYISKCPNIMDKKTPVWGYRLLSSPSNKQFIIYSLLWSPCC